MLRPIQKILSVHQLVRKRMLKVPIPPLKKRNVSGLAESDFDEAGEFISQFTDVFTKTEHSQVLHLNRKAPFIEDIVVSK